MQEAEEVIGTYSKKEEVIGKAAGMSRSLPTRWLRVLAAVGTDAPTTLVIQQAGR